MELLSPAGNLETAAAAFHYGADAVYAGLRRFSARADAENFAWEELGVLTGLAHHDGGDEGGGMPPRRRKVYITLNTLLREVEIAEIFPIAERLCEARVDGVIVQDLGVLHILRRDFPELPVHASTQMAVHDVAGMMECRRLGIRRVIAARELTLGEISAMAAVPGMELEVFVHGALCYAYSGLCLLSSVLRGTSGNRGECSYVCRNAWKILQRGGRVCASSCAVMSMKDLALPEFLPQLRKAGVASLKIEGRKKTPLYVAAVTNYYRKLLDGTFAPGEREECEEDIRAIIERFDAKLIVIDPWQEFLDDIASTSNEKLRSMLLRIQKVAEETVTTIVMCGNCSIATSGSDLA